MNDGTPFDAYYFAHCCGAPYGRNDQWRRHFGLIADGIVARIQPTRVLDAGCAFGLLVEALRERGVEAFGVDISEYAIANVPEPMRAFCRVGSIADPFPDCYDLIVSIEVLEHMAPADADAAVANFCGHADDLLFSSTPTDFREPTHVNLRTSEVWAEQFARLGFFRDVDFDASFVTSWAVRLRRRSDPLPRIVRDYERRFAPLAVEPASAAGSRPDPAPARTRSTLTAAGSRRRRAASRRPSRSGRPPTKSCGTSGFRSNTHMRTSRARRSNLMNCERGSRRCRSRPIDARTHSPTRMRQSA